MATNTFGNHFCITTFGESHGVAMGVVIDGCPSGLIFSEDILKDFLIRRRPGFSELVSQRKEYDQTEILSGVFENQTLGTPIAIVVRNTNQSSDEYKNIKNNFRVGHADDLWKKKFDHTDYRGGGRASGRETVSRVIGGAVAKMFVKKLYPNLEVNSFINQIGPIKRSKKNKQDDKIKELLLKAKKDGESYGGRISVSIKNCSAYLGEPVFKKLKSELAAAMMSVGATHLIEFGSSDLPLLGSQFHTRQDSSVYGGIRGGISTGEEIEFCVSFKPTSSILQVAKKGRHDPCIVMRSGVVLEAMAYLVLADLILSRRLNNI